MSPPPTPRRVGLVVDHPLRDLHAITLLAHLLARRGHEAVLMPFYGQSLDLGLVRPDLLVLNYVRPANLAFVREARRRGVSLAVLDTEGGLLPEEGPTSARGVAGFLRDSGLDEELALYMFWGEHLREQVVAGTRLAPERAVVTGCPRFDFAHALWADTGRQRASVLVNTNFPVVNAAHAHGTAIDHAALRSAGFDDDRIAELVGMVGAVMRRMIEAVAAIARARPDRRFVLRPHPFERAEPYREAFANLSNVVVRQEGSVWDALAEATCLLHVNCTTAIEAGLSGIAPISLDFVNDPDMLRLAALPTEVSHRAVTLEQALDLIDRDGQLSPLVRPDLVTPYFGPADGRATERVAAAIASVAEEMEPVPPTTPAWGKPMALDAMGRTIGSSAVETLRQMRRPARRSKALEEAEVARALRRFGAAQGVAPARLRRVRTALGTASLSLRVIPPPASANRPAEPARLQAPADPLIAPA